MSCTATLEEIAELRRLCTDYDLDGRQILDGYLNSELTHIYNGAGPDSWHDWSRKTLTDFMCLYKPLVLIHDVQSHESKLLIKSSRTGSVTHVKSSTRNIRSGHGACCVRPTARNVPTGIV